MPVMENIAKPTIKIMLSEKFSNHEVLLEAMNGVEEESIPVDVVTLPMMDDAAMLSYEGAFESVLEVGIGLDSKGYACIHAKSLPKDKPLFKIHYIHEREKLRAICSNAARLVKGIPFFL